jgi:hypothetical protein
MFFFIRHYFHRVILTLYDFQGFAIDNGLTDPAIQYEAYPDYALDMGLITKSQYNKINKIVPICELAVKLCGNSSFAFSVSHPLLIPPSLAELSPVKCFFSRCSLCF